MDTNGRPRARRGPHSTGDTLEIPASGRQLQPMTATPWIEGELVIMSQLLPLGGRPGEEPETSVVDHDVHAHRVVLYGRPETGSQNPRHG